MASRDCSRMAENASDRPSTFLAYDERSRTSANRGGVGVKEHSLKLLQDEDRGGGTGRVQLNMAKHRNGITNKVTLQLIKNLIRFKHATRRACGCKTRHCRSYCTGISSSSMRLSEYFLKSLSGGRNTNGTVGYPRESLIAWY